MGQTSSLPAGEKPAALLGSAKALGQVPGKRRAFEILGKLVSGFSVRVSGSDRGDSSGTLKPET
jgi:hypothetical protein